MANWSDFKAGIALGAFELLFLGSFLNYYSIVSHTKLNLSATSPIILIPILLLFVLNYFTFIHTDKWKEYNKEFDKLSVEKNRKGSMIVWAIIIFIIINYCFSAFYLQKYILKL